jgi:hypothetical protein
MNRAGGNRNRPYENILLNDLHEIMPEALYDSDLFNSPILRFFQQRVGHMFPAYHRERGLYLRDQADSRRHAFRSTRLSRMPNPVVPPAVPVVSTYESNVSESFLRGLLLSIMAENAVSPATPPVTTATSATTANTATVTATAASTSSSEEDDESDMTEGGRIINAPNRIIQRGHSGITVTIPGGARWWDPVAVRPSAVAYSRNTILMDSTGVPAGTVCTICRSTPGEDLSGVPITDTMWRKLRGCQHYFHKICADRWFEQNIHCPNCRADIRTQYQGAATEGLDTLNV